MPDLMEMTQTPKTECVGQSHSLSRMRTFYGGLESEALLRVMVREEFAGKIALLSSFGADSALLISMVAQVDPNVPVLFLETQKHFPATLHYVEELRRRFKLTNLQMLTPDAEMTDRIDPEGTLWRDNPNRCCWLRKVEPLNRALEAGGIQAIITGRKKFQTENRAQMQTIELDHDGRFRINPLAGWNRDDITREIETRDLPQHPLVAQGYLSIGCAPCTRPVAPGEDERAGRWAHTGQFVGAKKVECGIHVPEAADWSV